MGASEKRLWQQHEALSPFVLKPLVRIAAGPELAYGSLSRAADAALPAR